MPKGVKDKEPRVRITERDLDPMFDYMHREDISLSEFCRRQDIPLSHVQSPLSRARVQPSALIREDTWKVIQGAITGGLE